MAGEAHWKECVEGGMAPACAEGWIKPGPGVICPQGTSRVFGNTLSEPSLTQPLCTLAHQIEGTQKLLNKDLAELINKMRLAQQNAVTSLSEDCKRQMLTASHTLAVDAKNLLDAVDQAKVLANLAHPPAE